MPSSTFDYTPDRVYSLQEFEELDHQLKTHGLLIDKIPVNHFERDSNGRLIPMPQVPVGKEAAVAEIVRQLSNWNIQTRENGVVASSQGGFNFGGSIRAPDVSFMPKETYRGLTDQQIYTFQGPPFIPSFVVEVDNLLAGNNDSNLTDKFKQTYFPAGIELGWLVDPVNQSFFVFMRDKDGIVRKHQHLWVKNGEVTTVSGRNVLPGFELELWQVDEASSRVCTMFCLITTIQV